MTTLTALTVASGAWADDVLLPGGVNLSRVRIVGLSEDGRLEIRKPDGTLHAVPLEDIEMIQVDRGAAFAEFNQAERLRAEGRPEPSLARYRRAMRVTEGHWSEIIPVRFLRAADEAGDIDTAVGLFVRVVRGRATGPAVAVRFFPANVPDKRNGAVASALATLNAALAGDLDDAGRTAVTVLRYRILRHLGTRNAQEARRVARLKTPPSVRTREVFEVVYDAFSLLVDATPTARDVGVAVDEAIRACPEEDLPAFLLLKGKILSARATTEEDWLRAVRPFVRVPIHFPDDPRACAGYYGAAVALERAGRLNRAVSLLRLCKDCAPPDEATAHAVRDMLARLTQTASDRAP